MRILSYSIGASGALMLPIGARPFAVQGNRGSTYGQLLVLGDQDADHEERYFFVEPTYGEIFIPPGEPGVGAYIGSFVPIGSTVPLHVFEEAHGI